MTKEEIFRIVVQTIVEVLPELEADKIGIDDTLKEWGANSIDRAEITVIVMEELNINTPHINFAGTENIGDFVDVCHAEYHNRDS